MSAATHILTGEDASSQRTSFSSDHSEIPFYPRSDKHASPSDEPIPLPQDDIDAPAPIPLAPRDLDAPRPLRGDLPATRPNGRHLQTRPDTASTTASFASASADLPARPSIASVTNSRHNSPKKPPARIGRSFEALLASDETYVFKETAKVALGPDDSPRASYSLAPSNSLLGAPSTSKRVIVERRRQSSSSSSLLSTDLEDVPEDLAEATPRPPDADVFQSPRQQPHASPSTAIGAPLRSISSGVTSNGAHVPASPDRTTSLQRRTTVSPSAPKPAPPLKSAAMATPPNYMLAPVPVSPNATMRARPRASSSIGLEQEIHAASNNADAERASNVGTFRQRMKKTSGFLRKLRKDANQPRRDKDAGHPTGSGSSAGAYSIGSNPSATSLGRSAEPTLAPSPLGRRGSKASVLSQGASSTAGSTAHSATHKHTTHFPSTDGVAVPNIPERFMQTSGSSSSHVSTIPSQATISVHDHARSNAADVQELTPQSNPGLRVPSAPATMTEWASSSKVALPQRSSSQGHERNKSLASSDSTGAIRLAVQQLESQMEDALKESPHEGEATVKKPPAQKRPDTNRKQHWGPSPQLPDLNIQRYKERSGSFLEEDDLVSSHESSRQDAAALEAASTNLSASSHATSTPTDAHSSTTARNASIPVTQTGLGITEMAVAPPPQQNGSSLPAHDAPLLVSERQSAETGTIQRPHRPKPLPSVASPRTADAASPTDGADSPREQTHSARSSVRNSIDPLADAQLRRRTIDSGASLVSARSFETAAEAGVDSADLKVAAFTRASLEQRASAELTRAQTPPPLQPRVSGTGASLEDTEPRRGHLDQRSQDVSDSSDVAQEQSIRLVTKRSNLDDVDLPSPHEIGHTAAIIAPASPESALPKIVELSHTSLLRPGRNGSMSRGHSASSGSVRAGPGLLSTPSMRRSASPASSPTSARTSFEAPSSRVAKDEMAAPPSVAASAQELALKCWEEDVSFLKREKIAEWLGGLGPVNRVARTCYFANFDFSGLRLDVAFRRLCDKLFLRAETQQIDRILAAFSHRYFECNPDSIFGSADVIHSVVFSILLLNTDLHIAELQERMTRQQFVRNTLSAIAESSTDAAASSPLDDGRSSFSTAPHDATRSTDAAPQAISPAHRRNSISSYLGSRSKQSTANLETSNDSQQQDGSRPGTAMSGSKGKEVEIEAMLRDIYAAVKSERILLPSPEAGSGTPAAGRASGTFSPMTGGLRKNGKGSDRMTALKRGSIRGIQGLLGGMNSNNSFLDSAVSPNPSRSSVDSWGRPSASFGSGADRDRLLSPAPSVTPGFASTLSHTIIKESMEEEAAAAATNGSGTTDAAIDEDDDDDKLALAGPPWAKEGSLTRKHYWESTGKRAKDKNWTEVFVVVSKGTLSMFRFDTGSASSATTGTSSKAKGRASAAATGLAAPAAPAAALGGGNWLSNATCLGEISLAHSLANALPPPGYNRARPYVFALTLPGGKVFFFQTGHEELVNEWVSTCNYWAARQSKEPLAGGVSNMEYGWNKVLPRPEEEDEYEELDNGSTAWGSQSQFGEGGDARSVRSGKGTRGKVGMRTFGSGSVAASPATSISTSSGAGYLSHERVFINEWRAPQLPTVASILSEERQLARLEKQVQRLEAELTLHNELRQPMLALYSPRGANHAKALANWQRKSNHLLQELVKYGQYTDALRSSADLKAERSAHREVEGMIRQGDDALAQLSIA